MEHYSVLLTRETTIPVVQIATPLAEILGRTTSEITKRLRTRPWVLVEDVPARELDAIFELLNEGKIPAKAVPEVHMPTLPPPLEVTAAEPMPRGLFLESAPEPAPPSLDWKDLAVVSAGIVSVEPEEAPRMYGTGGENAIGGTPGSSPMVSRKKAEDHFLVDLVSSGPDPIRLRMDGADFSHDYLGSLMKSSSRENMKVLLGDIRARAPRALFTDRTMSVLAGNPTASFRFRSLDAFDTFTRWVLQGVLEQASEE